MTDDGEGRPGRAGKAPGREEKESLAPGGSVKRARERAEAGLGLQLEGERKPTATEKIFGVQPLRPGGRAAKTSPESVSPVSSPEAEPSPPLRGTTKRADPGAIGAAILKPATFQKRPKVVEYGGSSRRLNTSPTREDRLSEMPPPSVAGSLDSRKSSFSDMPSRPNTYASTVSFGQTPPPLWDENLPTPRGGLYAPANTPSQSSIYLPSTTSTSSRQSGSSSAGTIPEFPVPGSVPMPPSTPHITPTPTPRKSFGPPSSRRGYSSYYSVSSFTPIPEEGHEMPRSHISYASSNAIPTSWGSGPAQYLDGDEHGVLDEEEVTEDGQVSRGGPDDEERGLVRQASMGTRHRPSLTTIRSSDKEDVTDVRHPPPQTTPRSLEELKDRFRRAGGESSKKTVVGRNAVAAGATGAALAVGLGSSREGSIHVGYAGSAAGDPPNTSPPMPGRSPLNNQPTALTTDFPVTAPSGQARGVNQPSRDARGDAAPAGSGRWARRDPRAPPHSALSSARKAGPKGAAADLRNPPRMDGARGVDTRTSVTSLPDLIRRATTLATVLETDKSRPATRFPGPNQGDVKDEKAPATTKRSGSITDILASFPPPGLNSPRDGSHSRGSRTDSRWPTPNYSTPLYNTTPPNPGSSDSRSKEQEDEKEPKQRRCCGLPLWVLVVLVILTLTVAAAVIVPIALIVLPRQRADNQGALATCQRSKQCVNGGTNTVDNTGCHCTCPTGFTGDLCGLATGNGCVTQDITSGSQTVHDATVGSSIPRILEIGPVTFRVPLNVSQVISIFNSTHISCSSENALVTFDGSSVRNTAPAAASSSVSPTPTTTAKAKRQATSSATNAGNNQPSVATSNGIVFAQPTASSPVVQAPSSTPTGTPFIIDNDTLDFARVSVLYILQEKNLDTAVSAQQSLQAFLGASPTNPVTSPGSGITIDFQKFTLDLGNEKVGSSS